MDTHKNIQYTPDMLNFLQALLDIGLIGIEVLSVLFLLLGSILAIAMLIVMWRANHAMKRINLN